MKQHDERYARAEEYVDLMYKLFESSWRDDAVVPDREKGVYTIPDRIRESTTRANILPYLNLISVSQAHSVLRSCFRPVYGWPASNLQ